MPNNVPRQTEREYYELIKKNVGLTPEIIYNKIFFHNQSLLIAFKRLLCLDKHLFLVYIVGELLIHLLCTVSFIYQNNALCSQSQQCAAE